MRTDYKYIEKATSLVMSITDIGIKYIKNKILETRKLGKLEELLLCLEQDYIILENRSNIDEWVKKINNELFIEEGLTFKITKEHILKGIENNWIGFETVIWDEKFDLKHIPERIIFKIEIEERKYIESKHIFYGIDYKMISNKKYFKKLLNIKQGIEVKELINRDYK